jgi:restriction endonuclease S subunit
MQRTRCASDWSSQTGELRQKQPKDLPNAKPPREQESIRRQIAATDRAIDALVHELYGLTEPEIEIVRKGSDKPIE